MEQLLYKIIVFEFFSIIQMNDFVFSVLCVYIYHYSILIPSSLYGLLDNIQNSFPLEPEFIIKHLLSAAIYALNLDRLM